MRIAVVIPARNAESLLDQAIGSILEQTYTDWSLIVVDDGSTDNTLGIAHRFTDPRISVHQQDHAGVSAARNRGAMLAGNVDAFLFLDADDWLQPQALAVLASTLADCPWAVASYGRYARVGADSIPSRAAAPEDGDVLERLLIRNLFPNGGHILVAADAFDATDGFRTDLRFGEDWEFWVRLSLLGEFAATRDPEPLLHVRLHDAGASHHAATDLTCYAQALDTIYANPALRLRFGAKHLALLRHLADAEAAWSAGRALLRQGLRQDGQAHLLRSLRQRPSPKRLCLFALAALGVKGIGWRHADGLPWCGDGKASPMTATRT